MLGYKHFVSNLSNFLDVLLIIFIPWSAVNLTDYFLVRRGNYDVTAFFIPNGVYGKIAWRGLLAYAIGLAAEWPFVSQPDYVGPLVSRLGGADISWLVGFFVAAVVYLILVVSSSTRPVAMTGRWPPPAGLAAVIALGRRPGRALRWPARDVAFAWPRPGRSPAGPG